MELEEVRRTVQNALYVRDGQTNGKIVDSTPPTSARVEKSLSTAKKTRRRRGKRNVRNKTVNHQDFISDEATDL